MRQDPQGNAKLKSRALAEQLELFWKGEQNQVSLWFGYVVDCARIALLYRLSSLNYNTAKPPFLVRRKEGNDVTVLSNEDLLLVPSINIDVN